MRQEKTLNHVMGEIKVFMCMFERSIDTAACVTTDR